MGAVSRRVALGAFTAAAAGLTLGASSDGWQLTNTRAADDVHHGVQAYASRTSVSAGELLSFHATSHQGEDFGIDIYRVGAYGGAGGRLVHRSPYLLGVRQPKPQLDKASGLISCGWDAAWSIDVPEAWISGYYLAAFTTVSGWRSYTVFVVRDGRPAELCAIVPFTTYQAYNRWPRDGVLGRSLYLGLDRAAPRTAGGKVAWTAAARARRVGFDRPYQGGGLPRNADLDQAFVRWAEGSGYDITYASSDDLHAGRVDPGRYRHLVFTGHDEYWSPQMRTRAEQAVAGGTGLVFLSANNAYWRMRFEPNAEGAKDRVIACYKSDPDPAPVAGKATGRWRDGGPNPTQPEQKLLGIMYNGIVRKPAPLVVRESRHWLWQGTGVRDGDRLAGVVDGEADGFDPNSPAAAGQLTLLAASPYRAAAGGFQTQNTSLLQTPSGAAVFVAGSLTWPRNLIGTGLVQDRIRQMTANVLGQSTSR